MPGNSKALQFQPCGKEILETRAEAKHNNAKYSWYKPPTPQPPPKIWSQHLPAEPPEHRRVTPDEFPSASLNLQYREKDRYISFEKGSPSHLRQQQELSASGLAGIPPHGNTGPLLLHPYVRNACDSAAHGQSICGGMAWVVPASRTALH